jgi:hypothetical protein
VLAGAQGVAGVAVAGDDVEVDRLAGRVAVAVATARGEGDAAVRVGTVQAQLPAEELPEAGHDRVRHRARLMVAEGGDPHRVGVEAPGVRADHRPVHAAPATLVQAPEAVDQEVVADVRPAERLGVVGVDRPDHAGHLGGRVVGCAGGVVHEPGLDRLAVAGEAVAKRLVGAPLGARHDRRLGHGGRARGHRLGDDVGVGLGGAGVHEVDPQVRRQRTADQVDPHLDAARRPGVHRLSAGTRAGIVVARRQRPTWRRNDTLDIQLLPRRPALGTARANLDGDARGLDVRPPRHPEQPEGLGQTARRQHRRTRPRVLLAQLGKRRLVHPGQPQPVHLGADRVRLGDGRRDGGRVNEGSERPADDQDRQHTSQDDGASRAQGSLTD